MEIGELLPIWSIIPFVGMLLSIAIFPLVKPHWWEEHLIHVAVFWSLIFLVPFTFAFGTHALAHSLVESVILDYIPFITLLFGLFVVAGGIALKGTLIGSTKVNIAILTIGTALASWVGTTGAAMLFIRPLLRANKWRKYKAHIVVFFIFMVANLGGCLTPLGDPPLFLGYLRGVPFFWTIEHIVPMMLLNAVLLLIVYTLLDRYYIAREKKEGRSPSDVLDGQSKEKLSLEGVHNFIFLGMIISAVILNGSIPKMDAFINPATGKTYGFELMGFHLGVEYFVQIIIIWLAAFLSLKTTRKSTRELNGFNFAPIAEVAQLFIGIFITMIPALALLHAHGADLGLKHAWQFFWATGLLSSFLDNAPTYVVFLTTAGSLGMTEGVVTTVGTVAIIDLLAISAAAVFMGANTYIGNAPNFMVKSIAEGDGVKMPSFFGYMGWSFCILIPIFIINTLLFFLH